VRLELTPGGGPGAWDAAHGLLQAIKNRHQAAVGEEKTQAVGDVTKKRRASEEKTGSQEKKAKS
jgi:hypothetical protein